MRLEPLLDISRVFVVEGSCGRDEVLRRLSEALASDVRGAEASAIESAFVSLMREKPVSTPEAVAFPHALLESVEETRLAVALVAGGVDFGHAVHPSCPLVIAMVGPASKPFTHVQVLARLARLLHPPSVRDRLLKSGDAAALLDGLVSEDRSHV